MSSFVFKAPMIGMIAIYLMTSCALRDGYPTGPTSISVDSGIDGTINRDALNPLDLHAEQFLNKDDTGIGPHINDTHPGWKNPLCLSCHNGNKVKYPHQGSGYTPPTCVSCHGYNGAPHKDHAVKECHTSDLSPHVINFNAPNDCIQCHFHPQNPSGL